MVTIFLAAPVWCIPPPPPFPLLLSDVVGKMGANECVFKAVIYFEYGPSVMLAITSTISIHVSPLVLNRWTRSLSQAIFFG